MTDFPHSQLAYIAFLDFTHLALTFISANKISPSTFIILIYSSIAMNIFAAKVKFPHRIYTPHHIRGAIFALAAVAISFVEPLSCIFSRQSFSFVIAHALFVTATYAQCASTSHKEYALISWSQPLDIHTISCWVYFYQLVFGIVCSPIVFYLQCMLYLHTYSI
jgi:hypothetical protein